MEVKVSVVVPNYNHALYLRQRIDSILNQTFQDLEVILLDDASTDGSQAMIEAYRQHPRVTHVQMNTVNTGSPFKQWQKGIDLARGEWIWIAETDDYADETLLEKMLSAVNGRPDIGLVYCDSHVVQDNQVQPQTFISIKNKEYHTTRWSGNYVNSGSDEIENYLLGGGTINNTSAVLFNSKMLREADPFDMPFRYIGDKYVFVKVLARSRVAYIAESLNYYRNPFNSKHHDKTIFFFDEHFRIFDWVYRNLSISHKKFLEAFDKNTRSSVYRNWNRTKVGIYRDLFFINPTLFARCFFRNLVAPFLK